MNKFFPLVKVDETTHTVWGLVTAEVPDREGEVCDYQAAKAAYQKWSADYLEKTLAAGQEPSLGNIRLMHGLTIGGKAVKIEYRDDSKQIWLGSEPANDEIWKLLKGGFLTGYSHGGDYAWRQPAGKSADGKEIVRYAPVIGEVSYVDAPCLKEATFAYVKADGSVALQKFAAREEAAPQIQALLKTAEPTEAAASADAGVGPCQKHGATVSCPCCGENDSQKCACHDGKCPKCKMAHKADIAAQVQQPDPNTPQGPPGDASTAQGRVCSQCGRSFTPAGQETKCSVCAAQGSRENTDSDFSPTSPEGGSASVSGENQGGYAGAPAVHGKAAAAGEVEKHRRHDGHADGDEYCAQCGHSLSQGDMDGSECPGCGADLSDEDSVTFDEGKALKAAKRFAVIARIVKASIAKPHALTIEEEIAAVEGEIAKTIAEIEALKTTAERAGKGETPMTHEELIKAHDALLAKAHGLKTHLANLKAHMADHMGKSAAFHKGHHDTVMGHIAKAEKVISGSDEGSPSVSGASDGSLSVDGSGPTSSSPVSGSQGAYSGAPHPHEKGVTIEDLAKLLDEKLAAIREEQKTELDKAITSVVTALVTGEGPAPTQGLGEASMGLVQKAMASAPGKTQDSQASITQPGVPAPVAPEVVQAAFGGSVTDLLKLTKTIRKSETGVPPSLSGMKIR